MRTNPANKTKDDPFKDLPKGENAKRKTALVVAFIGVFVWLLKVVFGVP